MKRFTFVRAMVLAGLLSGCQTAMDRRIAAHQETWRGLSGQDQQRLRDGHVRAGDTETMVGIALGAPEKVQSFTDQRGRKLTAWLYDLSEPAVYSSADTTIAPLFPSRERSVIFHDGIMVQQTAIPVEDLTQLVQFQAQHAAESMTARLARLVTLTSGQQTKARAIFEKANEQLYAISLEERPEKGRPIRVQMRADIRVILTPEQQALYDATPQYLGGGATRRPATPG